MKRMPSGDDLNTACRKGLGAYPFNSFGNHCVGDGYYWRSVREVFGEEAIKEECAKINAEMHEVQATAKRLYEARK